MDCDRYLEWLSARLDGQLTPGEERELEGHLAHCPACRALSQQLEMMQDTFFQLEEEQAPEGFVQGVMDKVRGEERRKVIPLFRRPAFRTAACLAACFAVCVGLYGAGRLAGEQSAGGSADVQAEGSLYSVPMPASQSPLDDVGDAILEQRAVPESRQEKEDSVILTLERLPEGGEDVLAGKTGAENGDGELVYTGLSAEMLVCLEQLAQEQGISSARTGGETAGEYTLVVLNMK